MKKTTLMLTIATFISCAIVSSCNTPEQKVENAESDVLNANEDLEEANDAYLKELNDYRNEVAIELAANEQSIADFKAKIESDNKDIKAERKIQIEELEQKNIELKVKINEYNEKDQTKWEKFKAEFNHDMKELGNAFKNLGNNDVK
jgi:hypothetical protein